MNLIASDQFAKPEWGALVESFSKQGDTLVSKGVLQDQVLIYTIAQAVTLPSGGHNVRFNWAPVAGATGAEVTAAGLRIGAATTQRALGQLTASKNGNHYEITTSNKRIYSLKLTGLKYTPGGGQNDVPLTSASSLPGGFRLVVSIPDGKGGWLTPSHAVPPVAAQRMIPQTLTGATFQNGVLRLPDLVAPKIRLTLAEGARPDQFEARPITLSKVEGTETVVPKDLRVVGPDGSTAWEFPGEFPPGLPPVDVDLRIPLQTAFAAALAGGGAPDVTFKITGTGTITLSVTSADGVLLREVPGVVRGVLQGEATLPALGDTFASETPSSAIGDLTVRYEGIRLLETVTDQMPAAEGGLSGLIVTEASVVREFPPQALTGRVVRRVGLVGRAPVDSELHVQLVETASGSKLGAPGVLVAAPSQGITIHWVELPEHPAIGLPVNLSVTAAKGRFFWVVMPNPLVNVAIYDPDYPGREVTLGGALLNLLVAGGGEAHHPGYVFPQQAFVNAPLLLQSNLFLTVDIADLVLRYGR